MLIPYVCVALVLTTSITAKNHNYESVAKFKVDRYEPNWESLDQRPIPDWFDEAKIGIFLHWGVFSVPSFIGAWFWYWWKGPNPNPDIVEFMKQNYRPGFTYADFAAEFTAEFYDPDHWADIFKASGAK
jgi:alpha-L-fucosidase